MARARKAEVDVGRLTAGDVMTVVERLAEFLAPYQALMGWKSREGHLSIFMQGLLSDIERKSVEPIAVAQGLDRQLLQHFVGRSKWDEKPLLDHLRSDVASELGDADGVFVVDDSAVPKKGTESVGVARQWCGRLGKVDNCQVGVYLAYAGQGSCTLVDRRLYLPRPWAEDFARRKKVHVPGRVGFKTSPGLALEMVRAARHSMPGGWVTGDDEFGRPARFRDGVSALGLRYVLEVPSNIVVRLVHGGEPGRPPTWHRLPVFVRRVPVAAWGRFRLRDSDKGPIEVRATSCRVETRRGRHKTMQETLLVLETLDASQRWYFLTNAAEDAPIQELIRVASKRNFIEQTLQLGKGDAGLDHYEVRTWQGWHHHTACALIAEWFLVREKRRLGKKSTSHDGAAGPLHRERGPAPTDEPLTNRPPFHLPTPSKRGSPTRPLAGEGPGCAA